MDHLIFGIGNPLLDITADVSTDYLEKYGLTSGDAILAEEKHMPIYDELVKDYSVKYSGGGATQNTIRVAAALSDKSSTAYIGAVGDDSTRETLEAVIKSDGVTPYYQIVTDQKTGTCAVLINDNERTLVTALEAANGLSMDHISTYKEQILKSKIVYSSGYVLTACPDLVELAKEVAESPSTVYAINLAAPFICEVPVFREKLMTMISRSSLVFGNEVEALALGKAQEWGDDVKHIAEKIASLPFEGKDKKDRIVVITRGCSPTVCCTSGSGVLEHDVPLVPKAEIVDVNGAGDAFVGGFLAMYSSGKSIDECIEVGHCVAGLIIRRSGVSIDGLSVCTRSIIEEPESPPKKTRRSSV